MLKLIAVAALTALLNVPSAADELACGKVAKLPDIDGKAGDEAWKGAKELVVKIDEPEEANPKKQMTIKAVHDGTTICFLLVWSDADKNDEHSPLVWKDTAYEPQDDKVEDACSLAFELEGKFDSDMKAGIESKWDVWEWGAARTNPTGYALDRTHHYSRTAPPAPIKTRRMTAREGIVHFWHPVDEGTPCYAKIEVPEKKVKDVMLQFPPQKPAGSAADVEAKGEWADGKWTVEFKRKLNTGHKDDTAFVAAKSLSFAIATFEKSEKGDHEVSKNLVLKIQ